MSNRGPVSYDLGSNDDLRPVRAGGGLVAALSPVLHGTDTLWISTAVTAGDRKAAEKGISEVSGFRLKHLTVEAEDYRRYYDVIANGTLWFLHHNLFDLPREPTFDDEWWEAWHAYVRVNQQFAKAVAEEAPEGAIVLVHDYHLTMLGAQLAADRPDLRTVHFHHTPFVDPNTIGVLPPAALQQLLEGLAGHQSCGFHSVRWAESFRAACQEHLGRSPSIFVSAAAADIADVRRTAISTACTAARAELTALRGEGRRLLVRVDRIELSKNLVRGFEAYDHLLRERPEWRGRVVFAAYTYPTRVNLPEYAAYRDEVVAVVERINREWGTDDWTPVTLHMKDDFPGSVAAYLEYDVLLVNPIRDGLNLVSKEGALVNERDGVMVLSREAGSWHELGDGAVGVNPYDVADTADALAVALAMEPEERARRSTLLRQAAAARRPKDWFADQLRAAQSD